MVTLKLQRVSGDTASDLFALALPDGQLLGKDGITMWPSSDWPNAWTITVPIGDGGKAHARSEAADFLEGMSQYQLEEG